MINVVLVDDQTLVRTGISTLLGLLDDIRVIGESSDGEDAIELIQSSTPDVVLLDVRLPKLSGIEVLDELRKHGHLPPTILLTTFDDDEAFLAGMHAGAKGFLLKDVSLETLSAAVRKVALGESLFLPAMTEQVNRWISAHSATGDRIEGINAPLTAREKEILRLLAAGFSNKEIAKATRKTEGTVKNHVSNILSKLGVRDRSRAVIRAIQQGYL
jgi:DNA-binding NarL/FixJ family response regulator